MTVDQIVHMAIMRNRLMSATRSMNMLGVVPETGVVWSACTRIERVIGKYMLVHVVLMGMMQMPVM